MEGYGKRVLLVDDDDDVRTIMCAILRDAGYNVYEATDGVQAVDALKKRHYDVLLTDYHMPKMDGLELLDLTQGMWPQLPVVMATSDRRLFDSTHDSLVAPAYAILEKPFARGDLLNVVQSAVCGLPKRARNYARHRTSLATYQAVA